MYGGVAFLRLQVEWLRSSVAIARSNNCWVLLWLNPEHGMLEFEGIGTLHEVILNWLGWVHLEFRGAAINVHTQQWVLDMIVSQNRGIPM